MSHTIVLTGGDVQNSMNKIQEGGTQVMGGTSDFELNVTYNYSPYYYKYLDIDEGISWLYGKKARFTKHRIERAIAEIEQLCMGGDYKDYWAPTPSNAIKPLKILLGWCNENPEGEWKVY